MNHKGSPISVVEVNIVYKIYSVTTLGEQGGGGRHWLEAWILALALQLFVCVTLGKSFHFSGPHIPHWSIKLLEKMA